MPGAHTAGAGAKKTEKRRKRKQSGLLPSPTFPPEAIQGASCTIFDAALAPQAPRGHIVTGCAAESSTSAPGRGPWRLERRRLALVFSRVFFELFFLSGALRFSLFTLFRFHFFQPPLFACLFLSSSVHPPVPLALSQRSLSALPARARGGTRKRPGGVVGQGEKGEKEKKKLSLPERKGKTMPPADADDSLGKNSRYYKVRRLPVRLNGAACMASRRSACQFAAAGGWQRRASV